MSHLPGLSLDVINDLMTAFLKRLRCIAYQMEMIGQFRDLLKILLLGRVYFPSAVGGLGPVQCPAIQPLLDDGIGQRHSTMKKGQVAFFAAS